MKLFLASEGSDPRTTQKLDRYIGGFKGKKVVYVPTARNGENEFGTWKDSDTWRFLSNSGMEVTPLQLEDYKARNSLEEIKKILKGIDIVWMSGGACGYLMYWIRRTGFDIALKEQLNNIVYVGSSAGSMITAPTLNIAEWYINAEERGVSEIKGLGIVDFDFYPHYEDSLLPEIKKHYKGNKLYLVKNGDVVLVEDGKVEVLGEKNIIENE